MMMMMLRFQGLEHFGLGILRLANTIPLGEKMRKNTSELV